LEPDLHEIPCYQGRDGSCLNRVAHHSNSSRKPFGIAGYFGEKLDKPLTAMLQRNIR